MENDTGQDIHLDKSGLYCNSVDYYSLDYIMKVPGCAHHQHTQEDLQDLVKYLKQVAEPNRLALLCLLQKGELPVGEMQKQTELPLNLLSFHLQALKKTQLLTSRKEGLNVFYSLNTEIIKKYNQLWSTYLCDECVQKQADSK